MLVLMQLDSSANSAFKQLAICCESKDVPYVGATSP